jgi:hypothetical protein
MRRRRYLQAVALGASGLAGCNALDQGTDTPTTTPTPTVSPTATPREEAPNVDPPAYMELLPKQHLKGTEETPNANFVRVDWDWYLSHYDTEMRFGATSEEDWTLEANAGNLNETPPPTYRLLHTPVGSTIQVAGGIANLIPEFPNLGPELVRQCGFEMVNESGQEGSRAGYTSNQTADVAEIVSYAKPGFTFFIGINVDSLKNVLSGNDKRIPEGYPDITIYAGSGRMSGRLLFISEGWEKPVLLVETADTKDEEVKLPFERVTGAGSTESVSSVESVKWCLSEFVQDLPVQVGQINGGRSKFRNSTYVQSPIRSLKNYDTVFTGLDIQNGINATAQVVTSNVEGKAPTIEQLMDLYGSNDGQIQTDYRPSVSYLLSRWSR